MRRQAPRGPARQTDQSQLGTNPRCVGYTGKTRCSATNTEYVRLNWWCARHAPDETPDPNCEHQFTISVGRRTICSFCAGTLTIKETA